MEKPIENYMAEIGASLMVQAASMTKRADDLQAANGKLHDALVHAQQLLDKSAAEIKDLHEQIKTLRGE